MVGATVGQEPTERRYDTEPAIGGYVTIGSSGWPADVQHVWIDVDHYAWGNSRGSVVLTSSEAREISRHLVACAEPTDRMQHADAGGGR